ncbi:MAG: hypothetical protein RL648_187 [Verrucomicrobiota bacterium]
MNNPGQIRPATAGPTFDPVLREDFAELASRVNVDALNGTRWLICGATGLVPAYLCDFLAWLRMEAGISMALSLWVRSAAKTAGRFPWLRRGDDVVVPDWSNPSQWELPEAEFVVHAASPATPAACVADPYGVLVCNALVTQRLVKAIPASPLRGLLYLSSSEVYGSGAGPVPAEEALGRIDPEAPRSLYPLAKRLGESIVHEGGRSRGLPVRVARLFHTYGPGLDLNGDTRAFAEFVAMIVRGEVIRLRGDGRARRAYCYLADTCAALLTLLLHPDAPHVANVGNPHAVLSVTDLAQVLMRLAGHPGAADEGRSSDVQSLSGDIVPDISRLTQLGWEPRTCPEDGFARTLRFHSR